VRWSPSIRKPSTCYCCWSQSNGRDLSKDEIIESIWPGQILEESNLTVNISAVRRALGEKAAQPRFLVTIPGRGYRLSVECARQTNF
jgi:DNA-binding winged helix-turn-helix (wHTH) protein